MSHGHTHDTDPHADPTTFWEGRYAGASGIWSGRPNAALVDEVADLPPGRALELGCGEGADAVWLAGLGWTVTGLDLSPTALRRAEEAGRAAGVGDRLRFEVADLAAPGDWPGDEAAYDLVTACFLQTPLAFPRAEVLCRAADRVAPGGRLVVVAHAAAPPWADIPQERHAEFQPAAQEVVDLALGDDWELLVAEDRERQATLPDGRSGALLDSVVVARRR